MNKTLSEDFGLFVEKRIAQALEENRQLSRILETLHADDYDTASQAINSAENTAYKRGFFDALIIMAEVNA